MIGLYLLTLTTTTAFAATLSIRDASCTPGSITANNRQCTIECGTDHPGGDYSALSVSNFQACIDACTSDANCKTAQYQTTNSYCYLKGSIRDASSNNAVNGVVCPDQSSSSSTTSTTSTAVAASCTPGPITINGKSGTVECDTDHPGGDYSSVNVQTFQGCENACATDTTCLTAQYDTGSNYCYLKSSINAPVKKTGVWGIVFGTAASSTTTSTTTSATTSTTTSTTTPIATPTTTPTVTPTSTPTITSATTPTTTSTTSQDNSSRPPPGCATAAPSSPYLSNGGFENGKNGFYNPRGTPVNFDEEVNGQNVEEGCKALNVQPITYHRPYTPVYSLTTAIMNLQDQTNYTLSFFVGGYSPVRSATIIQVQYSIGRTYGAVNACGANTYPSSCNSVTTTGIATGQIVRMNFAYTSDQSSNLNFIVTWQGLQNDVFVLDDIRVTPA